MYNLSALSTSLAGLVGFSTTLTGYTTSRSGLWVDGAHALLTEANLIAATGGSQGLATLFSVAYSQSVAEVLAAVRTRKLNALESRFTLLAGTRLYEGEGSVSDTVQPGGRFVGLRLYTDYAKTRALLLHKIGLQLTGALTDFPVYIYAVGEADPLAIIEVTRDASARMRWFTPTNPVRLPAGGTYLIGYYEDDLGDARAIRRTKTIGPVSCTGCEHENARLYEQWRPFVSVEAVRVDSTLFNVEGNVQFADDGDVMSEQNFGLNLQIGAECDLTDTLIKQQAALAEALQQQLVVRLLSEIAYSTRTTAIEQQIRDKAMFALKNGEEQKLQDRLNAVTIALSDVDPMCLPESGAGRMVKRTNLFSR